MPRYANREMMTPPPQARERRPAREKEEWEGKIYTVKCDDGTGRTLRLRARRATPEEFRRVDDLVNERHAEDLQALADL